MVVRNKRIDRAGLEAGIVTDALDGRRVLILAPTKEVAAGIFRTVADAFKDDDGKVLDGVTIKRANGAERIDLRNGGRILTGSTRSPDRIRGLAIDRAYTPAGAGVELLRALEAATIQSAAAAVIEYPARDEA